jgi:hypothetical protein
MCVCPLCLQLVFGDQKTAFLLPWRRLFNITDAQVRLAARARAGVCVSGGGGG